MFTLLILGFAIAGLRQSGTFKKIFFKDIYLVFILKWVVRNSLETSLPVPALLKNIYLQGKSFIICATFASVA